MKAITRNKYGSPDVLTIKEVDIPIPKKNEILVKIYSTTVNRTDCGGLTGKPYLVRLFIGLFGPRNKITGTDFAGQVMAIGEEVSDFSIGDRVFGLNDEGLCSHAEYMTIKSNKGIAKIPDAISYAEAAASAEGAHYAINTLNKVNINDGDKAIVNGATGAIGSATIQLLHLQNVEVTAVCGSKNVGLIESLGVHKVIDYEKEDFTNSKEKFRFVFDTVGSRRFSDARKIMTSDGVYISSELGPMWENTYLPLITKILGGQRVKFPIPSNCRRSIETMADLLRQKKFLPLIDRIYPMEDIKEAYRFVQTGMKTGNVILKISE